MIRNDAEEGCAAHPIARNSVGLVVACPGCGTVQLTLEYLSLRFQPAAFRELVSLLALAQCRLERDPAGRDDPAADPFAAAAIAAGDEQVH